MQENRHHIKTRMLKAAARAWGYPETEAETAFDPLVSMMLAACSSELEKISGEIHASRARVTERLVQLLSPDVLTGPLPAHAVACGLPVESKAVLSETDQLYIHRKLAAASDTDDSVWKDIFFSPTASFRLNRSSIKYMATGNQLYKVNHSISKETIAHSGGGKTLPPSTLYLAIDEAGVPLNGTQFYFGFRNEADKQLFYHQLAKTSWHFGDQDLEHVSGYGNREISGERLDFETILGRSYEVSSRLKKHINAFYKSFFITLFDDKDVTAANGSDKATSDLIGATFSGKEVQAMQQHSLRWIRIQFPQTISNRLLQDVVCVMNAFTVMNRRLLDLNYRLQEIINIIPLQTEDTFLDLEEVSDDDGKLLNVRSFGAEEDESFALLLRSGGVGRFDERDAASIINYLLQLLRDESAAFSTIGNDFIANEVKQLHQIINKLEQRLHSLQLHREQNPYLVIRNNVKKPWHNLFIQYWSTNGKEGNTIKAGTPLQLYKGGMLDGNGAVLVTTTQGGRDKLSTTESVLAYKSALLSKDRIVTSEDIKAFCHYQLGERVKEITVEKGIMIHPDQQRGFLKTIDVVIDIRKEVYSEMVEQGEVSFWMENLKILLEEKSAALMPYRIIMQSAKLP